MDGVVDLAEWRRRRPGGHLAPGARSAHPAELARLERAVDRLHELVGVAKQADGRLEQRVETELLAILGELTIDMFQEATARAERLADGLAEATRSGASP